MTQWPASQVKALIHLISSETGPQAHILQEELGQLMKQQPQVLMKVIEQDFHSEVPISLVKAMQQVYWEEVAEKTEQFAFKINPDMEEALLLTTRFVNPAVTRQEIEGYLTDMCQALRPLLANCTSTEDMCHVLTRFFFHVQKFSVCSSVHDIKECSFGRFLRKKYGSVLCMCCLYAVCARRFGLDGNVIDLAGRLAVRLSSQTENISLFIDPLHPQQLLTEKDCQSYIFDRNLEWNEGFVSPLSSRDVLRRFFGNMIFILNKLHDERRLVFLRRYMDILKD